MIKKKLVFTFVAALEADKQRYREALVDLMHRAVEARQVALKGDSLRVSNELYLMAEIVRAALQGAMSDARRADRD